MGRIQPVEAGSTRHNGKMCPHSTVRRQFWTADKVGGPVDNRHVGDGLYKRAGCKDGRMEMEGAGRKMI